MDTFKILAEDLESGRCEYDSKKIAELYEKKIGSKSPIHRYHVLNPNEPSTTIIAHLHKDGNRLNEEDLTKLGTVIKIMRAAQANEIDKFYLQTKKEKMSHMS